MRYRSTTSLIAATGAAGLVAGFLLAGTNVATQAPSSYQAPRTAYKDGKPDLNGIWQALNTAYWDIEEHSISPGPLWQLGAIGGIPPGKGVVEGGKIPYKPEAAEKKKEKFKNRLVADVYRKEDGDPELKCYLPGIPRATYMPYPFQIMQTPRYVLMSYSYGDANRVIHMQDRVDDAVDTWMGWSNGRWEGDTLVVETTGQNGYSWLDRAGNFASENLKVVERFTRTSPDHLDYEATLDDPTVFTRPWKIQMPLYRIVDKNPELLEYRCVELSEEALYGRLSKQPSQ